MRLVQILAEVKSNFKMNKQIFIIHENDEWVVPLREELKKQTPHTKNGIWTEKKSSFKGMQTIAKFLFDELNLRD